MYKKRLLVEGLTKVMFNFGTAEGYNLDQTLLQKIFWPSVKDDAVNCQVFLLYLHFMIILVDLGYSRQLSMRKL